MDYVRRAAEILFGEDVLDNAARGLFLEALVYDALRRYDERHHARARWLYAGQGWGPWDLQRGRHDTGDRVRVQMKVTARRQRWTPVTPRTPVFNLGWKTADRPPGFVARDFPQAIFGDCEAQGFRADLLLLAWNEEGSQADPNTYRFYILPAGAAERANLRRLSLKRIAGKGIAFDKVAIALNRTADRVVASKHRR